MSVPTVDPDVLHRLGEHFAAGAFELPESPPIIRWSRALRRFFEGRALPAYQGSALYPRGAELAAGEDLILCPSYSYTWTFNESALRAKLNGATGQERDALEALGRSMTALERELDVIHTPHVVGGRGYTHSIPNYGRVIREGLGRYRERLTHGRDRRIGRHEETAFEDALLDLLAGIEAWHSRLLRQLQTSPVADPQAGENRERLYEALSRVPFAAARTFYEALVCYHLVYYIDGCDNPGRLDLELSPYYEQDLLLGRTSHAEAVELIRAFWQDVDQNNGWSAGIGGTGPAGGPAYSDLTLACLQAARGMRRPNVHLHVRRDMPREVWEEAFATVGTGCGQPAFNNDELFAAGLRDAGLDIAPEDLAWRNGGGCTETMIHGRSNVGSLDAGLNLALVLEQTLRCALGKVRSFDELFQCFAGRVRDAVREIAREVSADQEARSRLRPQPVRSLLIDDCVERSLEFNAGGARYNWSVINVAGLANVIDSLAAVQELVYERGELSAERLRAALASSFDGADELRARLRRCPRFGNDDPAADHLASIVSELVFSELLRLTPWRGGRFLPACLMFVTYADAGRAVGALPDGRGAGEPLADSAGPYQGRDRTGPTAMLRSVARLAQRKAPGTLVVNARLSRQFFSSPESREKLRDLVRAYFDLGGMQLQFTVVDQEVLRDAMAHPDCHEDLIVRIGGYSEYFTRLDRALQLSVLERTEHRA